MMGRSFVARMMLVLGAAALLVTALPAPAHAQAVSAATSKCADYAGLTAKIAGCIRESIDEGAQTFFAEIYPYLQSSIDIVMTLAVIIYGIMLAYGAVEKVGRDTYILLMKLAAVVIMANSSPWIASTVTGMMDGAGYTVASYAPTAGQADAANTDFSQSVCMQVLVDEQSKADPSKPLIAPWFAVDCLIDTVIGIKVMPATAPKVDGTWYNKSLDDKNGSMARSLLYLFFGCMQSSILGLVMAVIGFFFIYGLVMLIIRCLFTYIAGYMGITFLAIISPLIIPLILFKETKQYFDKWAKMLISFALQPVLMLIFLIFSIVSIDIALFSGNYSVYYSIAGDASRAKPFDLNKYLTDNKIINSESKTMMLVKADNPYGIPKGDRDQGGTLNQLLYANCSPEALKANPSLEQKCAFTYPLGLLRKTIDWAAMEKAHSPAVTPSDKPGQAISRMVMSSVFFCLMVVFILNGILQIVPSIVGDLLGDLNQSPLIGGLGFGQGAKGKGMGLLGIVKPSTGGGFDKFKGMVGLGK